MTEPRKMVQRWTGECWDTVEVILASPRIFHYTIGLTKDVRTRTRAYRGTLWPHFVVLADNLSREDALSLENSLHLQVKRLRDTVKATARTPDTVWKAANASVSVGPRPSSGPITDDDGRDSYSVYLAFREGHLGEVSDSGQFRLEVCRPGDPSTAKQFFLFEKPEHLSAAATHYEKEDLALWAGELAVPFRKRSPIHDEEDWIYYWWNGAVSESLGLPKPKGRGHGYVWSEETMMMDPNPVSYSI